MMIARIVHKLRKLLFRPYRFRESFLNTELNIHIGTYEASRWYGKHKDRTILSVAPELEWTKRHLLPGDVVVDAGAHHGVFSILYAKWVTKSGKIYAFECNAQNYEIMLKNIEINGIRNIEPQFLAVGDSAVDLMMPEDSAGFLLGNRVSTRRVSQIRLDDYFREKGVFPTFLKIDVEGYELNVLEGAQNILRRKPKVLIEFHNFAFQDPRPRAERILAFLGNYHSFFLQHEPGMAIHRINNRKELIDTIVKHHNPHLYVES